MNTDSVHTCRQTENPRHQGFCACGKRLEQRSSHRSEQFEAEFVRNARDEAERRFGTSTNGFESAVESRLRMGEERYPDRFLTRDGPRDILEEAWDAAAYAALETQKRFAGDEDDVDSWHLYEVAVHAAAIDFHARMLRNSQ